MYGVGGNGNTTGFSSFYGILTSCVGYVNVMVNIAYNLVKFVDLKALA